MPAATADTQNRDDAKDRNVLVQDWCARARIPHGL